MNEFTENDGAETAEGEDLQIVEDENSTEDGNNGNEKGTEFFMFCLTTIMK